MLKKMDNLIIGNTSESTKIKNFYKGQHKNTEILERIADIKNLEIAFQAIRKSSSNIVSDETAPPQDQPLIAKEIFTNAIYNSEIAANPEMGAEINRSYLKLAPHEIE